MRNVGFISAILAALAVGALIGWFALPMMAPAVLVERAISAQPTLPRFGGDQEPAQTSADPGTLAFSIDTTLPASEASGGSPYRPSLIPTNINCSMPPAGEALVVLLSVYEGQALSTVALGSRDEVTGVLDVVIEGGDQPLYIILSAFSDTIWRFSGATDRVERVVLMVDTAPSEGGRVVRAGVVGLDANTVKAADRKRCFGYAYDPGSMKAVQVRGIVRRALGREPDVYGGYYDLAAVRLPSARGAQVSRGGRLFGSYAAPLPRGFDGQAWNEMLAFNPAGLARIDADAVVSTARVLDYDVLPQGAGLAQLAGAGDLERLSDGFKIVRPIPRFPAGLHGAHSTAFLIAQGVPVPSGDPGHGDVLMESTGKPPQSLCRGSGCGSPTPVRRPAPSGAGANQAARAALEAARTADEAAAAAAAASGRRF